MDFQTLHGQVIEFTEEAAETEIDFDKGMKARVIGVSEDHDDVIVLVCDFSDFEEENKKFAKANYYDDKGDPTLCWHETKGYPVDKKESVYVDKDTDECPLPFIALGGAYPSTAQCLDALEKTLVALMSPSRPLWRGDLDKVCLEAQEILQNAGRGGTPPQPGPSISLIVSMNTDDDCQLEYMGDLFCFYGTDLLISKSGFATVQEAKDELKLIHVLPGMKDSEWTEKFLNDFINSDELDASRNGNQEYSIHILVPKEDD